MGSIKKILIVSHGFYPETTPRAMRATELAKEFARQGHTVTVITTPKAKEIFGFGQKNGFEIKLAEPVNTAEINWVTKNKFIYLLNRIIIRLSILLLEYPSIKLMPAIARTLKKETTAYDLLISIAVPHPVHWGVAKAWANMKELNPACTWVADCGDPFFLDKNDTFRKPFYFKYIEKWFMRKADIVTVPIEEAKNAYFKEFHTKIKVIPQGLSFPEIKRKTDHKNEVPTFAYFGAISPYIHAYKPFFSLLNQIKQPFLFIIYTNELGIYHNHLSSETLKKCHINPYLKREELLQQVCHVDFLLHFPYQVNTQSSLKLVDYDYLKKPVISYAGATDDAKFNAFLSGDYNAKETLVDYKQFDIKHIAERFIQVIKNY